MNAPSGLVAAAMMFASDYPGYQQTRRPRIIDYFSYDATVLGLAGGATGNVDVQIESDSDFLLFGLNISTYDAAAPSTIVPDVPVTIQIKDGGSGRELFDQPQAARNVAGFGADKGWLPFFRRVKPSSTLRVTYTNLDPAVALDVRLSLEGVKVFLPAV